MTSGDPAGRLPLIVGISGATGSIYGVRMLKILREIGVETHLVISKAGEITLRHETGLTLRTLRDLGHVTYPIGDIGAAISSGSLRTAGMVIAPCSIRTMSAIAYGNSDNLLTRAADVILKERRRLVLMLRETPLNLVHINAMKAVTEAGGVIAPPVPAFYINPESIDDLVNHTVLRVLDLFGLDVEDRIKRWQGLRTARPNVAPQ
jgi:4-hydroxy-3-polyprenylbenzoate decarboxylase